VAGLPKVASGGWVPFLVAGLLTVAATTWLEGRRCVARALADAETPVDEALPILSRTAKDDAPIMVLLTGSIHHVPFFARHGWLRDRAREERVVLLTLVPAVVPYLKDEARITVNVMGPALTCVTARFGYLELLDIGPIIRECGEAGIDLDREDTSFFYADPKIERSDEHPFPAWRRELFVAMRRIARPLPDDLNIAAERRIELGVTVKI
jgi:KUP system potassium uptake protein